MSKRLSVGNLSNEMTEEQLNTLFSEAGLVASAKIISYLHNGQTCGFGFVEMKTIAEGQNAISILNGRDVDGRALVVKADRLQSKCSFSRRSRN
jgi:RNA recognition motif-containing protein